MKKQSLFLLGFISLFLMSCMATVTGDQKKLYDNAWELEYITGPRITFQGLFPNEKPMIMFNKTPGTVTGTSGCNVYDTTYTLTGNMINIEKPTMATTAYCGDGEVVFLKTMEEVTKFRIESDGKLTLLMNDIPMMKFKKAMIN
ncbi:META domain-containing protein [Kaistella polysaccharea]|uniref:META domain-containing protein n=1 Tax=Kaistella polysaccharea TaxID=2878534 RepID=UPI001CF2E6DA|nr:META domain-containing protein [Kaistella polysaccharea]